MNAYVVGDTGLIMHTTNGGTNWLLQNSGITSNLTDIAVSQSENIIATGYNGAIVRTTNQGASWDKIQSPANYTNLNSVVSINNNIFIAVGNAGTIIKSTNGGMDWRVVVSPVTSNLTDIDFTDDNTGYVCGGYYVIKTLNGGENWDLIVFNGNYVHSVTSISFVNNNTGFAVGYRFVPMATYIGVFYKTTDGGNNWTYREYNQVFDKASFLDPNTGYVIRGRVGYEDTWNIGKTTDGGNSWNDLSCVAGYYTPLTDINFLNVSTGWVLGWRGILVKTVDGGGQLTGISSNLSTVPIKSSISQNYPNPFNPTTKIKFDVPKSSFTKIVIYDLLGRVVTTLLNEELKPGTYSVDWDGSNYASGIYFYRLETDDFVQTKKMVLMK